MAVADWDIERSGFVVCNDSVFVRSIDADGEVCAADGGVGDPEYCNGVGGCLQSSLSVAVETPKLTLSSESPAALVLPPLTPANAEAFFPPIIRTSADTEVPSESETSRVLVWTPKLPVTLKKSATPMVASVATLSNAPLVAG